MKTLRSWLALSSMTLPGCQQTAVPDAADLGEASGAAAQTRGVDTTVAPGPRCAAFSPPPATGAATFLGYAGIRMGSTTRRVSETDAAGMVTSWRFGMRSQVDCVVGCC